MTRDEAIVVLKNEQPHCGKKALFPEEKKYEAYDIAIKALEREPCEDCISRESVLAIAGDSCLDLDSYEDTKEFCDEINDLPPVTPKQEPCEDCISREELLKAIDTWDKFGCDADNKLIPVKDCYVPYIHYDDVVKCVKGLPSVNPKSKTGHWIDGVCSECGYIGDEEVFGGKFKYCPVCGAVMRGEE